MTSSGLLVNSWENFKSLKMPCCKYDKILSLFKKNMILELIYCIVLTSLYISRCRAGDSRWRLGMTMTPLLGLHWDLRRALSIILLSCAPLMKVLKAQSPLIRDHFSVNAGMYCVTGFRVPSKSRKHLHDRLRIFLYTRRY